MELYKPRCIVPKTYFYRGPMQWLPRLARWIARAGKCDPHNEATYTARPSHIISPRILPLKSGTVKGPSPLSALQKFEQRIISLSTNHPQFITNACETSHPGDPQRQLCHDSTGRKSTYQWHSTAGNPKSQTSHSAYQSKAESLALRSSSKG